MGLLTESENFYLRRKMDSALSRMKILEEALTSERRKGEKNRLQLTTNPETGLPNSIVLHREIDEDLNADENLKAVIFVALNENYDMLKKTFSNKIPELILFQTAVRLQKVVGNLGRIYHTKEEEFLIFLKKIETEDDAFRLADRIVDKVEKSHVMGGFTISLGINLGIAFYPEHGTKKSTLLRHADIALAEAVKNRVSYQFFTTELKEIIMERVEIQNGILIALESQAKVDQKPQFELFYQPQVEIEHWGTPQVKGRLVGAEALIRWNLPGKGLIPPSRFIPVAEETGLIIPLGHWIMHTALTLLQDLKRQGDEGLAISINLSARQFNHEDIATVTRELVKKRGVNPKNLKLEITESGIMNNYRHTVDKINLLRSAGFKILIDDFGTGYSSLSYLKKLPIDVLKIDKSFVDGVPNDSSDQALIKAILTIARDLNLGIIVEGTETKQQVDWLFSQGCQIYQGYYFGKPLTQPDFLDYVQNFDKIFQSKI